jgi:chromosomal replication initiation ATPase DnaA
MSLPSPVIGARQLRLDLDQPPSHAREDFVVSASNEAAVAAIDSWPRWPGGKLALIGPAGSGKTHLAQAWATRVGATMATAAGASPSNLGPILLEDADRCLTEELLFHLDNRADAGATLLVTGRSPPGVWPVALPDLRSRLNALTVANIEPPDDFVLLGVMQKMFSERNIKPKPGITDYAIRRIERSAPAVQNFVRAIDELAGEEKREVTLALVRRVLQIDQGTL